MKNNLLVQEFIPSWTNGLFLIDFLLSFATSTSTSTMLTGPIVGEAFHKEIHVKMSKISPSLFVHFLLQKKGTRNSTKTPLVRKVPNFDSEF